MTKKGKLYLEFVRKTSKKKMSRKEMKEFEDWLEQIEKQSKIEEPKEISEWIDEVAQKRSNRRKKKEQ